MSKSIVQINIFIRIGEGIPGVIGRVNVNDIDTPLMRFFQQTQAMEIIALKEKVIDFICGTGDFSVRVFFEM